MSASDSEAVQTSESVNVPVSDSEVSASDLDAAQTVRLHGAAAHVRPVGAASIGLRHRKSAQLPSRSRTHPSRSRARSRTRSGRMSERRVGAKGGGGWGRGVYFGYRRSRRRWPGPAWRREKSPRTSQTRPALPARPKRRGDGQPEREGTSGGGSVQIDARVARAAASGRAPPALGCPSRGAAACVPTTRRRRCRRRRPGGRGPAGTAGPARRAGPSPPAMAEAPRCH